MNRKGTVIQPQSASKASTFLQAWGKIIGPPPPPPSQLNIRSCKNKKTIKKSEKIRNLKIFENSVLTM